MERWNCVGPPRARDITEAQVETILNKVLDTGINYIDTSIDYGLSGGADRPLHLAPAR
jgi:predicted aldo/keto reductase-like oxidoreductase